MNVVLLSGGSGQRLWPLSNSIRSKQFIKMFSNEEGELESMLTRVYRQIMEADPGASVTIATSRKQVSVIKNQLGDKVHVCVEPKRRDTFPAICLAAAYLHDRQGVGEDSAVVVCPVDPYVEDSYFQALKELARMAEAGDANLSLLGIEPTYASEKYGYIIPASPDRVSRVSTFQEKPDAATAEQYIARGALWNGGVFAFRLGYLLRRAHELLSFTDYQDLYTRYGDLEKISFDYAVVEQEKEIQVLRYNGGWKDLGTWNTLTEEMPENSIGDVTWDDTCSNSHAINVLGIPMVVMGAENMVIAASHDGILVADKHQSSYIKKCLGQLEETSLYEERRWGTIKTIDRDDDEGIRSITKRIKVVAGKEMPYHRHLKHTETITVLSGMGKLVLEGIEVDLMAGATVSIAAGKAHAVRALGSDLRLIEVSLGDTEGDEVGIAEG